jgi:hypothetical protein
MQFSPFAPLCLVKPGSDQLMGDWGRVWLGVESDAAARFIGYSNDDTLERRSRLAIFDGKNFQMLD